MSLLAWHFVNEERTLRDGNTVEAGYVYEVERPIRLCSWGLHASINPLDALTYAPGPIVCRVRMSGEMIRDTDKLVATRREVLWMADATDILSEFARECALDVIHLWDAPVIVRRFLETGDEALRDAARDAARTASRATAEAAARDAAWNAAEKTQSLRLEKKLEGLSS